MCPKTARRVAKCIDPDQMPHCAVSDLVLHCFLRPVCPNIFFLLLLKTYVEGTHQKWLSKVFFMSLQAGFCGEY